MQVVCKLAASLQISSCNKSDFDSKTCRNLMKSTDLLQLVDNCNKPVKSTTCSKSVAFWLCTRLHRREAILHYDCRVAVTGKYYCFEYTAKNGQAATTSLLQVV